MRCHYPGCLCGPEFSEVLFGILAYVAPLGDPLFRSIGVGGGDSSGGCSALVSVAVPNGLQTRQGICKDRHPLTCANLSRAVYMATSFTRMIVRVSYVSLASM